MDGPSSMRMQISKTLMVEFCMTPFSELTKMLLFTNSHSRLLLSVFASPVVGRMLSEKSRARIVFLLQELGPGHIYICHGKANALRKNPTVPLLSNCTSSYI